jgi:GNAT superfamily N-acetyltransferase
MRMEITIRPAVPADAPVLAANNRATALETEDWVIGADTALDGVRAILDEPGRGFYLVADMDGDVVGQVMVTYEWSDYRNGEFWWIQSVYVRPDWRRRGVFTRLFRRVEAMAVARPGVTGLRLYVEGGNTAAQTAYSRLGMRRAPYVLLERDWVREPEDRGEPSPASTDPGNAEAGSREAAGLGNDLHGPARLQK